MSLTSVSLLACCTPGKKSNFVATSGSPWPPLSFCHPQGSTAVEPSPGNIASEQGESEREHFSSDQGVFLLSPLLRNGTGVTGSTRWHPLHATVATVQKLQMLLFVVTKVWFPAKESKVSSEARP